MRNPLQSISTVFELIRWANCAMAGSAAVAGTLIAYLALPETVQVHIMHEPFIVFLVVFFITGAGNAINDYFDLEIDRVNRPRRPIPSGRMSQTAAFIIALILFCTGIILSYWLGPACLFIAIFNSILLFLYAYILKQTVLIGNIAVGYLGGSTFLFGGALEIFEGTGIMSVMILFLLAGLATLAREIVKDIQDMEGDLKAGATTLPIKIGEDKAKRAAAVIGLTAVMLSPLPFVINLHNAFGESYLIMIFGADILFLISINELLLKDNAKKSSKLLKMAMFLALLGFVVGTIV
ncbi:MAG: geranylgeranylglycerol-phosphate geranylgeranyltransferase [Methanosarcinales archaeon]|nr:geranylgeranylglycerol-phosphate geranylgeranyltransferase [Methanosarcinales archaeon]